MRVLRSDRAEIIFFALLFVSIVLILISAWFSAPNTWDAMTYHMSRVLHWVQNESLALYPTHIIRQLYMNPFAEYAILQFQLLSGNDAFANLIQWFSMVGSLIGVSAIAALFRASRRGQLFAALTAASIPMAVLQGSSTQNDFVLTFWLTCLVFFVLKFLDTKESRWLWPVGFSLGLAVLTKGTAYFFALPFIVWLAIRVSKESSLKLLFRNLGLIALLALLINTGNFSRNLMGFGSPFGPESSKLLNAEYSIAALTSNSVRNASLHLGTIARINTKVEAAIIRLHQAIGIGVNDPETTYNYTAFSMLGPTTEEDYAGNLLHALIGIAVACIYVFTRPTQGSLKPYLLCLLSGFILFSLLLRWQPWHSRLHLPLFVLSAPVIGLFFERWKTKSLANLVLAILWLSSMPWLLYNYRRPLVGESSVLISSRTEQTFRARPELQDSYVDLAKFINTMDCRQFGIVSGEDSWEYPVWILLQDSGMRDFRIEHVLVENESRYFGSREDSPNFSPCLLITIDLPEGSESAVYESEYSVLWQNNELAVFAQD